MIDCVKDVIKFGGEWIFLVELENCFIVYLDVFEVVVVGVFDECW